VEEGRVSATARKGAGQGEPAENTPPPLIPNVRTCARCIMDETAKDIIFDDEGICNYCTGFLEKHAKHIALDEAERERRLSSLVEMVKASGRGKRYDCIVGLSGGVDSSWTLVKVMELGLRPLAVHMDSGWNSELAQNNIANLVRTLGVDLYTHVIEWPEIRGLMEAFFASDVIDVEVLYDNAMLAVNYQQAAKYGLKFILAGSNVATEGIDIPKGWNWYKSDKRNIVGISRRFGGPRLKTFPSISTLAMARYALIDRIRWISFLDHVDYRKAGALEVLKRDFGYKPYPHKHYESVFTRFYQGYLQPYKFGVDKRKPHLSSLIMNGEISREEALRQAQGIAYPSEKEMEADRRYFIKKMGWSEEKFEEYMRRPERPHDEFPSEAAFYEKLLALYRRLNLKIGRLTWS
jgi:N-acetyl sugar amidotransferase